MNKTERDWQAVNLDDVKKQLADPNLITSACGCTVPIHTFRIPGDSLEGRLRPCPKRDRNDRAAAAHLAMYDDQGNEYTVAIRLSKMLWSTVNKNHLWGCWIRITYKGSAKTGYGHAKKIYLVEKDRGGFQENWERVKTVYHKSKKPRKVKSKPPASRPGSGVRQ